VNPLPEKDDNGRPVVNVTRLDEKRFYTVSGPAVAQDETLAPEEENQSQIDDDPRLPSEMQPPTRDEY
jgi:hypothetical protein